MRISLPILLLAAAPAVAAAASSPAASSGNAPNPAPVAMDPFVVTTTLDTAREDIVPSLGASTFHISSVQIDLQPLGANAPFSQVILQAPGVAQDSAANGDLHVRGEHGNLQYRINDVLLPEGITGFGLELDPRFVGTMQLITGSLPAQYGFRTAGIIDIHTKTGAFANGGEADAFGGSFDTRKANAEISGTAGRSTYFADASVDHSAVGIENPTSGTQPIHDHTDQYRAFTYLSRILGPNSRISFMDSASVSRNQVPDTPGLPPGTSPDGRPWLPGTFDSASLNEHQTEQNYYGIVAYQRSTDVLNLQLAGYGRISSVHFVPDPIGDLFFNGVASDVDRRIASGGLQADVSLPDLGAHTVRGGMMVLDEHLVADTTTTVFPVNANGDPIGPAFPIVDNQSSRAGFFGLYLQDEWRIATALTANYGARFDVYSSSFDRENQVSPRVNLIYHVSDSTSVHAGYARYFTPPPLENVSSATLARFTGTSNASAVMQNGPVKSERADYFDAGVSHSFSSHLHVGLDGYYKIAKDQLDDGLFGQSLILSAFNYRRGRIRGVELTTSYTNGGVSAYVNAARAAAQGKDWNSAQFLFSSDDLTYVANHWIHLDHDQRLSLSAGASNTWKESRGETRISADLVYGSGLSRSVTDSMGNNVPNGGTVPAYGTINLGIEQTLRRSARRILKVRLDVVNLTDRSYELRDGTGVGVNAAQWGMRRGFFGSVSLSF